MENVLKTWMDTWIVGGSHPGAILAVHNKQGDEIFYHEVDQSIVSAGETKKYNRDSIFRIYSMTKPITVTACLILVDRGLISLSDPVSKYIPAFAHTQVYVSGTADNLATEPPNTPISLEHLMTHTSGITYGIFGSHPSDVTIRNKVGEDAKVWFANTDLAVLCDKIAEAPLVFHPGTSFLYGLNTDILGRVIEVVSGLKFDEFLHKEIFSPLEMVDTDFFVPQEKLHRLLECYEFVPGSHQYKESLNAERDRTHKHAMLSGGGGLVSTLRDYSRFARCLLNGGELDGTRIVSAASVELMTSNRLPNGADISDIATDGFSETVGGGYGFGLGVAVLTKPDVARGALLSGKGEYGWGGVASTFFLIDPVQETYLIFLTQLIPSSSYPIRSQLRYLAHRLVKEKRESEVFDEVNVNN